MAFVAAALVALAIACAPPRSPRPTDAPVVDLHVDTLFQTHFARRALGETQLRLEPPPGGVVLSIHLPSDLRPGPPPHHLLPALLDAAVELRARIRAPTWLSYEGAPDEAALDRMLSVGVVIFGLAHAWHSDLADAATDPHPLRGGLTEAGVRVVRAIHAAGAVVDVAHLSRASFDGVVALARETCAPVIATHTAARAVHDHARALDDDQLRAVAASGGLAGMMVHAPIVGGGRDLDAVAAHIAHAVRVAGADHVAIGSDLDGNIRPVRGIATTADLPSLAAPLTRAGLDGVTIAAVLGGNARRFLDRLPGRWTCR
jgi:membrane dipeptidase